MSNSLKEFIQRWIITTVAVLVAAHLVRNIHYDNWQALLVATLVLGLLNAFLKPLLMVLSLPFLLVTLGLFMLVINAFLLYTVGQVIAGFHVDTFGAAIVGALIVSVMSLVLNSLTRTGNSRVIIRRGQPPPKAPPSGGSGPIIDV